MKNPWKEFHLKIYEEHMSSAEVCQLQTFEYIGEKEFVAIIDKNKININVISCVIQRNNNNSFVSNSKCDSYFVTILSIHHDINEYRLKEAFSIIKFNCIKHKKYMLPDGKEFIRMDFKQ